MIIISNRPYSISDHVLIWILFELLGKLVSNFFCLSFG